MAFGFSNPQNPPFKLRSALEFRHAGTTPTRALDLMRWNQKIAHVTESKKQTDRAQSTKLTRLTRCPI